MKINAGTYKYRRLEIPEGIRPTTGKVREAVGSMLLGRIEGAVVLDLFAGSGALGLELLSRGAARCYFGESDRRVYRVLADNVRRCRAEAQATLYSMDYRRTLSSIPEPLDIVYLDPPYRAGYYEDALKRLGTGALLTAESLVLVERLYDNILQDEYGVLQRVKTKKYGTIAVDLFAHR